MKIVVIKDSKPIDQYVISGRVTTIGRRSECDIPIKDPAVSGVHARIEKAKGKYIIRDEGSTNGIYVKGRRVQEHELVDQDLITIGEHRLQVIAEVPAKEEAGSAESPQTAGSASAAATKAGAPADVKPAAASTAAGRADLNTTQVVGPPAYLAVTSGTRAGETISLTEGLTKVGEPGIQVAAISRRPQGHFIIHVDGGKDRERMPKVNGEVIGFKSRKLEEGDEIEVAGVRMTYELAELGGRSKVPE